VVVLQQLNYLAALARERHFARAAEACHVSQPTLSAGIRRLEQQLGVPLVQREHHFQGLTPEGERMLEWAHRILADCDGMQRDLVVMRDGLSGRLRLGAIPTALPAISLLTGPLRQRHQAITLFVESLSSREIERRLHESKLDAGLTYLDSEPLRGVRSLTLYRERYVFLARATGRYAKLATISWEDAATAPLCLLSPAMQNRRILDRNFHAVGAAPLPVVETNSIATLYAHVRDQRMYTVMAHTWLRLFGVPADMRAIPLTEPDISPAIGLVWLDRDPEPLLAKTLVATARRVPVEALLHDAVADILPGPVAAGEAAPVAAP
jgi:DNA-binding transcriptional LysR family regulator